MNWRKWRRGGRGGIEDQKKREREREKEKEGKRESFKVNKEKFLKKVK
jgi:hypothetical protein